MSDIFIFTMSLRALQARSELEKSEVLLEVLEKLEAISEHMNHMDERLAKLETDMIEKKENNTTFASTVTTNL